MLIGIIHTVGSPCRCAESVAEGLGSLGHEVILANSEAIECAAPRLARHCDLVIDHTDTYRGRGALRAWVRMLLEVYGARIVGSDARACLLADNKAAAKGRLTEAGVPTPAGIVLERKEGAFPYGLRPPLILKPVFEHMSRGIQLARTEAEAKALMNQQGMEGDQPILVETFIPGRELAISVLEGPSGIEVLPILEWDLSDLGENILSQSFKLKERTEERRDARPAALAPDLKRELEGMARLAFRALGLRDYGRFDLRLDADGAFYFLEANPTPSLEPLEAFARSARWAGLDYPSLIERMLHAALRRYGEATRHREERLRIDLKTGPIELIVPQGVHLPPASSVELAQILDIHPGESVLDLGCGCGLLAIAAAKQGAKGVVAIDRDPKALAATLANARRNGVEGRIETRIGSWYGALREEDGRFDVIVATPPQTPGPEPFGPKYGGWDGTKEIESVLKGASAFLHPERGRFWVLALSLANPSFLWRKLSASFIEVILVKETERVFTAREYEEMKKGLFDHLQSLRSMGKAEFRELEDGHFCFRNLFFRARGVRTP